MDKTPNVTTSVAPEGLDGYSQRFEYRPEFRSRQLTFDVIDASTIRERHVADLMVIRIDDVFSGKDEIFLGFGVPNVYLVCPDGKGNYQKYAAKSLKRAPSTVADTRGFVQSGILLRFKNLPPHAAERLREAMQFFSGQKFWTCLNGCLTVMERAGFASPSGGPLSDWYMPASYMEGIFDEGLLFDGQPVQFEVIRTSPTESIGEFGKRVKHATNTTPCRHADRALKPLAKQNWLLGFIENRVLHPGKTPVKPIVHGPVAPALSSQQFVNDIHVRVSLSSYLGSILRGLWGSHALHEAWSDRVDPGQFLTSKLQPFPQKNPDLVTRLKKRILFSRFVIWAIRLVLAPRFCDYGVRSERNIYDMIRTHSEAAPAKYNLVLMGTRTSIARINTGRLQKFAKLVDWILSKHVLMSGYDPDVLFAGEMWKDAEGTIHVNRNSGTYKPSEEELDAAVAYLQALLPHVKIVKDALPE